MTVPVRPQVPGLQAVGKGRLGLCAVALAAARYRPVRWRTYVRMRRTYVYKLKPTAVQDQALNRYLNVTRNLYNAALEQRITVYRRRGETRGWRRQSREIKNCREAGLLQGCHVHTAQTALKRLDLAYGGAMVRVDAHGTSQECSGCGVPVPKALRERWHSCPDCGLSIHRGHNAAINIGQRAWAVPVAEAASGSCASMSSRR